VPTDCFDRDHTATTCNTFIKALNVFCLWARDEGHATELLALPLLKVEKRVIVTLTDDQIRALLKDKPKQFDQRRLNPQGVTLTVLPIEEGITIDADKQVLTAVLRTFCKTRSSSPVLTRP